MAAEPNQGATGDHPGDGRAIASRRSAWTPRAALSQSVPEVFVGAAFAGGLALALILRRITSE